MSGEESRPDATGSGEEAGHHDHLLHDVGSVAEEAAKLLGVLGDWAKDQGQSYAGAAAAGAAGLGEGLREIDRHVATGAEECRFCPLCLMVTKVRATSPEVRQHLSSATTSLLAALAGMLATPVPDDDADRRGAVERIDLGEDPGADTAQPPSSPSDEVPWWSSGDPAEATQAEVEHFEDLAAASRSRRSRRPCAEEEEPP